jgi:hypothetical protein
MLELTHLEKKEQYDNICKSVIENAYHKKTYNVLEQMYLDGITFSKELVEYILSFDCPEFNKILHTYQI